jgi:hypothetical protein
MATACYECASGRAPSRETDFQPIPGRPSQLGSFASRSRSRCRIPHAITTSGRAYGHPGRSAARRPSRSPVRNAIQAARPRYPVTVGRRKLPPFACSSSHSAGRFVNEHAGGTEVPVPPCPRVKGGAVDYVYRSETVFPVAAAISYWERESQAAASQADFPCLPSRPI